jgi:hypothetical protein
MHVLDTFYAYNQVVCYQICSNLFIFAFSTLTVEIPDYCSQKKFIKKIGSQNCCKTVFFIT